LQAGGHRFDPVHLHHGFGVGPGPRGGRHAVAPRAAGCAGALTIGQKQQVAAASAEGMVFDMVKREQSDRDGSLSVLALRVLVSREGEGVGGRLPFHAVNCVFTRVGSGLAPGRDGWPGPGVPGRGVGSSIVRASGGCLGTERR
jgi:hypothetical protein